MAEKRTKIEKWQRQEERLEKKAERRPERIASKKKVREDLSRAA